MGEIIKEIFISLFYTIHLMFDQWLTMYYVVAVLIGLYLGCILRKKSHIKFSMVKTLFVALPIMIYSGSLYWIFKQGGFVTGKFGYFLQYLYYLGGILLAYGLGNNIDILMQREEINSLQSWYEKNYSKIIIVLVSIFIMALIPIALVSPYVFAKADDYSFGYHCHIAWETTGSFLEVIKAAIVMVKEAYWDWQGTHSSIFMMAIQPAVFHEKLYALVPFFFIGVLTISTYCFFKVLFVDFLKTDKRLSNVCTVAYLIMAVQCVPVKQSAFFWYNGAIHYMGSHFVLLLFLAFLLKLYLGEKGIRNLLGAVLCAWYMGGGNYVTAVGTLLIVLTILFFIFIIRMIKLQKEILISLAVFIISFMLNVLAPGNVSRMGRQEGYPLVQAFFMAFYTSLEYMLGKWLHWTILVFLLFMLPFLWKIAQKAEFKFSCPLLVIGYSWCYMASLFFAPLYTIRTVEVGRFQNIMFLQWMILLVFDITYFFGWLQRRCQLQQKELLGGYEKKYLLILIISSIIMLGLGGKAEPEKY
ncbi:MAG: hypothetical protein IKW28_01835, partial [Lachnospiraceae bacterium]|nr:hypothetical protein [Lachnospiraceae bacterium]